jgi:hypothetical protein
LEWAGFGRHPWMLLAVEPNVNIRALNIIAVVGPRKNTLATRDPQSGREIVVTEPPRRLFVGPWLVTALRGSSLRRIGCQLHCGD